MIRDALLVAGKDLRIEWRSRVALSQVVPFALMILVVFAFALDDDRATLRRAAPGLFWVAVLLSLVLAVQRSFSVESADGNRDHLRLSGLDPAGIFLGKSAAVAVQLLILEVLLTAGVVVLYNVALRGVLALMATAALATLALAAAGTSYGAVASGLRLRETLVPLLLLPVLAPVLLCATQAATAAIGMGGDGDPGPWLGLLACFAAGYLTLGILGFGAILEET